MLVFPSNLEEVEEVCCRGVDGDEVLIWFWSGVWEGGYGQARRVLEDVSIDNVEY